MPQDSYTNFEEKAAKPGLGRLYFSLMMRVFPLLSTLSFLGKLAPFLRHLEHDELVC